jgi:hypothetical protein
MAQKTSNTGGYSHTTPLSEAAARASWPDPEFVDCRGLEAGWGIKRSLAYALLADGKIRGVSLRRRNQVRGKRLFKVDSVRAFLNSQMESAKIESEAAGGRR